MKSTPRSIFQSNSIDALRILCAAAIFSQITPCQTLALTDTAVSDFDGGISVPKGHKFSSGDRVFFLSRITGYKSAEQTRMVELEYAISATDCLGRMLAPPHKGNIAVDLGAKPLSWQPEIKSSVEIPSIAMAGPHRFHVWVKDRVSGTELRAEEEFEVQSKFSDPAVSLTVREFNFHRAGNDPDPADPPVFHAGDTLWARFYLTGFRTVENNRYDLRYGVALRSASGRAIFSEADAASESKESFYPKSHVPGVFSIRLERSVRPGSYSLVLRIADAIGKQEIKSEHAFQVD
jgi:hypothetical protein